jgi:hypothetical protein
MAVAALICSKNTLVFPDLDNIRYSLCTEGLFIPSVTAGDDLRYQTKLICIDHIAQHLRKIHRRRINWHKIIWR